MHSTCKVINVVLLVLKIQCMSFIFVGYFITSYMKLVVATLQVSRADLNTMCMRPRQDPQMHDAKRKRECGRKVKLYLFLLDFM